MPSVKRLNSVLEDGLDIPRKLAKLDQRDTRIKELERDLEVMHEFVIEQDMLLSSCLSLSAFVFDSSLIWNSSAVH